MSVRSGADARGSAAWWVAALVAGLCLLYFLDPNPRLDFSPFDQHDAESYLSLSQSLVAGRGYTRSLDPHYYVPHAYWPPGMAVLLMPMTFLSGVPINLLLIKLGMIAYGVIGILLAYLYGRRLSSSPLTQLCVPLFLGLNPYYWQFSRMTNTEMPTIVWSLLALLLNDIAWSRGMVRTCTAFALGVVCGLGMLIRGSFFGALFLPLAYVFIRKPAWVELRQMAGRYVCYGIGFLVPFVAWMLRNRAIDVSAIGYEGINQLAMIFRRDPAVWYSPVRSTPEIFADMLTNVKWHIIYEIPKSIVPGLWPQSVWDGMGKVSAPVALLISAPIVILFFLSIRNLPAIIMAACMTLLYLFYAMGEIDRFWVPVTCLMAISLPIGAERLPIFRAGAARSLAAAGILGAMAISLVFYARHHDEYPYHDPDYAALAGLFSDIRDHGPVDGAVLTPNSQAFVLYTGRNSPMTMPGLGIKPAYRYVIVPTSEWIDEALTGTSVAHNDVWSLIRLPAPMTWEQIVGKYRSWRLGWSRSG